MTHHLCRFRFDMMVCGASLALLLAKTTCSYYRVIYGAFLLLRGRLYCEVAFVGVLGLGFDRKFATSHSQNHLLINSSSKRLGLHMVRVCHHNFGGGRVGTGVSVGLLRLARMRAFSGGNSRHANRIWYDVFGVVLEFAGRASTHILAFGAPEASILCLQLTAIRLHMRTFVNDKVRF